MATTCAPYAALALFGDGCHRFCRRQISPLWLLFSRSYHIACAQQAGCTYYCDIFQVACPSHARHFAKEVARQNR